MPIYTFRCPDCGSVKEEICRADERTTLVVWCGYEACLVPEEGIPSRMIPVGMEVPVLRTKGKYRFKAVTQSGERLETVSHTGKGKRSDT